MSNFSNPLQGGKYVGEIISQKLTKSSNDNTMFEVTVGVLAFSDASGLTQVPGKVEATVRMPLTENSAKYTIRKLASCGFEGSPSQWNLDSPDAIDCTGNQVDLVMKIGEFGQDWDIPLGSSSQPVGTDQALIEDAKWSHKMPKGTPTAPTTDTVAGERPTGTFASME
jgi:hypothetical protein